MFTLFFFHTCYIFHSFSSLFGNQPDIVKPSLSSRLGPPLPNAQSAVEKGGDEEEEGEWDGEEEELGEEEEIDGGEGEEEEGDDHGDEENLEEQKNEPQIKITNEPPALDVEPPKYDFFSLKSKFFSRSLINPLAIRF